MSGDGLESQTYEEFHSSIDRYRDVIAGPDGITFYAITDPSGSTSGPSGTTMQPIQNHGVVVKIEYTGVTLSNTENNFNDIAYTLVPNPTSSNFKIISKQNDNQVISRIRLVDIQGRQVKEISNFNINNSISIEGLTNGMYFVQLLNDLNQNIATKKLIIKQ